MMTEKILSMPLVEAKEAVIENVRMSVNAGRPWLAVVTRVPNGLVMLMAVSCKFALLTAAFSQCSSSSIGRKQMISALQLQVS